MTAMPSFETLLLDRPADNVLRITMNRPDARNAQDLQMTYELNDAFNYGSHDPDTKVIILAGSDPHFSSGHDLRGKSGKTLDDFTPISPWGGADAPGAEGRLSREHEIYLDVSQRWRDLPKPTIAAVQGKCIAGGLMLAWVCDLIVASDDAQFCDLVVAMGVCGVEWFAHPHELGYRKAKEMLFTGDMFSAEEAYRLGMVNHVVPRADMADFVVEMAAKIATKPLFALKTAKAAVNKAQDAAGFQQQMSTAFALHQLCHSHNMQVHNMGMDPSGLAPAVKGRTAGERK
jgi:enoyl-CoA hydratase